MMQRPARPGLLVVNAMEVATVAGGLRRGAAQQDVAALLADDPGHAASPAGPAVAAFEGRIIAAGRRDEVERRLEGLGVGGRQLEIIDAQAGLVTPGLIDPHTHLLFAGTREAELELRQRGHGYLEILAAGGGILSTVARTRAASDEALLENARRWLAEMLRHGVTTAEAKSGYGLTVADELRLLRLIDVLDQDGPVELVPTYMGAHAVPPEYRDLPDAAEAYVASVIEEHLPAVADQGVAQWCDVFCEEGVFTVEQSRRILEAGRAHGLAPRLHADELLPSGGAELAVEVSAGSADHLGAVTPAGIRALATAAEAGHPVVATLLPATMLFLMSRHHAPARALIDAGIPVALGSDFNPGTSPTPNLALVLTLACLELAMSPSEALTAVTINAATALGLEGSHGSLEPGKHADFVIWGVESHAQLPYWVGADLANAVFKSGRLVYERS